MIKSKLKELLSELKKFNVKTILVLESKKRYDCNTSNTSSTKLIACDSDVHEGLTSLHQSIMTKRKLC